jgi:hypothetical protein
MRTTFVRLLAVSLLITSLRAPIIIAQGAGPQPGNTTTYEQLVARVQSGDMSVDFTALRTAFTQTAAYREKQNQVQMMAMTVYRRLWDLLDQGHPGEALDLARVVIASCFVDINAQLVAAEAYRQVGNERTAAFHRFVADGLLRSVMGSGAGGKGDSAFRAVLVSDEYALLRSMGFAPVKQTLYKEDGHTYDMLSAKDPKSGAGTTYYFNIDAMAPGH